MWLPPLHTPHMHPPPAVRHPTAMWRSYSDALAPAPLTTQCGSAALLLLMGLPVTNDLNATALCGVQDSQALFMRRPANAAVVPPTFCVR